MDETGIFSAFIVVVVVAAFCIAAFCIRLRFSEYREHERREEFEDGDEPDDGLNEVGRKINCSTMNDAIATSAPTCGLDLSRFGHTTTVHDLNAKNDVNVGRRLHFGDETMNKKPDMAANNSDSYYIQKNIHGRNRSSLDLTMNDDPDERFRIMGNSCRQGSRGCAGPGVEKHFFQANGDAGHDGDLRVGRNVHASGNLTANGNLDVRNPGGKGNHDGGRFHTFYQGTNTHASLEEYDDNVSYDLKTHKNNDVASLRKNRAGDLDLLNRGGKLRLDRSGNVRADKNLHVGGHATMNSAHVDGDIKVDGKIRFGPRGNDPYSLEKVTYGKDRSHLRLSLNDNPDESLRIYTNIWNRGGGDQMQHKFQVNGDSWHRGKVMANQVCAGNTCVGQDELGTVGLKREFEKLKQSVSDNTNRHTVLTQMLKDKVGSLKGRIENGRGDRDELEKDIQKLESEMEDIVQNNTLGKVEDLKKEFDGLQKEIDRVQRDVNTVKGGMQNDLDALSQDVESVKGGMQNDLDGLRRDVNAVKGSINRDLKGLKKDVEDVRKMSKGPHKGNLRVRGGDLDLCRSGNCNSDAGRLRTYYRNNGMRMSLEELDDEVSYEMKTHRNNNRAELTKSRDGTVFIRNQGGHTMQLKPDGRFCLGGTCIDENALKTLNGERPFTMRSHRTGKRLQDGGTDARFQNHNRRSWERMYFVQF